MKRHIDKIKDATYERGYVYNVNYREDKYISLSTDYSKANVTYLNY